MEDEKRHAQRLGLTPAVAEEVVAEAALLAHVRGRTDRGFLNVAVWKLAANARNQEHRQGDVAARASRVPPITNEHALFASDFDRAFRNLPRALAEAWALTELRGLTEREAASELGTSQKTVNRRCEAARNLLKESLT